MDTINFLVVDDHSIIIAGLRTFIERMMNNSIIDEAANGQSALEKIQQYEYHLVILDANTLGPNPFEMVSNILAFKPHARILIFSMYAEEVYAKKYLQLGVKGYLSKDASEVEIKNAIKNILSNKKYISASLIKLLKEDVLGNRTINPFENLSPREFEIVQHLIRDESVAEICQKLKLHTSTVGTFKARIFEKLHFKNIIDINNLAKIYNIIRND